MATLIELRQRFREMTGRYDLVDAAGADTNGGATIWLNEGQVFLDQQVNNRHGIMRFQKDLAIDDFVLDVVRPRSIKEVWVSDADGRKELDRMDWDEMRFEFGDPFDEVTSGGLKYYSIMPTILAPDQQDLTSGNYTDEFTFDGEDLLFGTTHFDDVRLVIMPPAEAVVTVSVFGTFYSKVLAVDADVSYWSIMYPDLMLYAAAYKLEIFYQNLSRAQELLTHMREGLRGMDHDIVEEEVQDINQMRG